MWTYFLQPFIQYNLILFNFNVAAEVRGRMEQIMESGRQANYPILQSGRSLAFFREMECMWCWNKG